MTPQHCSHGRTWVPSTASPQQCRTRISACTLRAFSASTFKFITCVRCYEEPMHFFIFKCSMSGIWIVNLFHYWKVPTTHDALYVIRLCTVSSSNICTSMSLQLDCISINTIQLQSHFFKPNDIPYSCPRWEAHGCHHYRNVCYNGQSGPGRVPAPGRGLGGHQPEVTDTLDCTGTVLYTMGLSTDSV